MIHPNPQLFHNKHTTNTVAFHAFAIHLAGDAMLSAFPSA
jgi:hypothetical protein